MMRSSSIKRDSNFCVEKMIEGNQGRIGKQLLSRPDPRAMEKLATVLKSGHKYMLNRNFFKYDRVTAQEISNL